MLSRQHPLNKQLRRSVLTQPKRADVGHVGSALPVVPFAVTVEVHHRTGGPGLLTHVSR